MLSCHMSWIMASIGLLSITHSCDVRSLPICFTLYSLLRFLLHSDFKMMATQYWTGLLLHLAFQGISCHIAWTWLYTGAWQKWDTKDEAPHCSGEGGVRGVERSEKGRAQKSTQVWIQRPFLEYHQSHVVCTSVGQGWRTGKLLYLQLSSHGLASPWLIWMSWQVYISSQICNSFLLAYTWS